jgi:hypothetical protein
MRLRFFYGRQLGYVLGSAPIHALRPVLPGRPKLLPLKLGSGWRGARTKSASKLKELAQGALESREPCPPLVNDAPQYPTVVQGARNNMIKFKNCVVLTRVGNFYEVGS